MSKDNFFRKLFGRLFAGKRAAEPIAVPHQNGSMMGKLLQMVSDTDEVEFACDEVFELLDQYVELEARGEDVARLLPLVKKHLDNCGDCHEEYEALAQIIAASPEFNI